jgi:hypothetical protein
MRRAEWALLRIILRAYFNYRIRPSAGDRYRIRPIQRISNTRDTRFRACAGQRSSSLWALSEPARQRSTCTLPISAYREFTWTRDNPQGGLSSRPTFHSGRALTSDPANDSQPVFPEGPRVLGKTINDKRRNASEIKFRQSPKNRSDRKVGYDPFPPF